MDNATRELSVETPEQLMADGSHLLEVGDLARSERLFLKLAAHQGHASEGYYGASRAALRKGDVSGAEKYIEMALGSSEDSVAASLPPTLSANISFQMGLIAERRGLSGQEHFRRALSINPRHAAAAQKLGVQPVLNQSPPQMSSPANGVRPVLDRLGVGSKAGQRYGAYSYLTSDGKPTSQLTIEALNQLELDARPRLLAHTYHLAAIAAVVLLLPQILFGVGDPQSWQVGPFGLDPQLVGLFRAGKVLLLASVAWLAAWLYLSVALSRVVLARGRLQYHKGVLWRHVTNVDLWRIHDVAVHRSPLNRLLSEGTLILTEGGGRRRPQTHHLTGVYRGDELEEIAQVLLNLLLYLRSNELVRGVLTY